MKTLPDGKIQVESGDTLSGIYGSKWKEISGYSGDPTKLQIGTILPAKPVGSLGGTLTPEVSKKELPQQPVDKLSMFGDVLKMVTQRAAKEATARGGEALPEGMLRPEQVSGGTFANVLNTINQQKTRGIADIYESTIQMIDDSSAKAKDQLQMLVNTGGIAKLDDDTLDKLAGMTGFDIDYLKSIREIKMEDQQQTTTTKMDDRGRINELNTFLSDKIGEDGKISAKSYMEAYKEWIGLDGSINDFKYAYPVDAWVGEHEFENLPAGWKPAEDEITLREASKAMALELDKVKGADGYVSPDNYKKARYAWVRETGLLADEFDDAMAIYRNPDNDNYSLELD